MKETKENPFRKLARSNKWQSLYARSKELSCLRLFHNEEHLTRSQLTFLQLLEMFNRLYSDLAMNEKFISEEVIDDEIRTEAYLFWKRKERENKDKPENEPLNIDTPKIKFTRGKK